MIEYNAYFGGLLVAQAGRAGGEGGEEGEGAASGLLRVQPKEGGVATYAFSSSEERLHSGLGIKDYAHCSSPIRRYSDLHNQHMLFDSYAGDRGGVDGGDSLKVLNKRVAETSFYHAMVVAMELGYRCKEKPTLFRGQVEFSEDSR